MELLLQQLAAGLATGSIYACVALSVVMIYQSIGHINFAQGEMAMLSTFVAWQLLKWGLPYWVAFVLTLVLSFAFGCAVERVLMRPLAKAPALSHVAVFVGLLVAFNSLAGFVWDFNVRTFPSPFGTARFLGSNLLSTHQAGVMAVVLCLLAALFVFFRYTRVGLHMRAATANPESARLVGINVGWMGSLGWGMASVLGAVAGILIAPVVFLEPNMMVGTLIYGSAGAVLGGLASPAGAAAGGIIIGVLENLAGTFIPVIGGELKLTIALVVIVVVLLVKPQGLFGRVLVTRV